MKENEGVASILVKKDHLKQIEQISRASGVSVRELIEKAISQYLANNRPEKQ